MFLVDVPVRRDFEVVPKVVFVGVALRVRRALGADAIPDTIPVVDAVAESVAQAQGRSPSVWGKQMHGEIPACAAGRALVRCIDLPRPVVVDVHEVRVTDATGSYHVWWLLDLMGCCCWQGLEGWDARGGWDPRNAEALPTVPIIVHWGRTAPC